MFSCYGFIYSWVCLSVRALHLSEYFGFSMSMDCSFMSNLSTRVYVILLMMLSVRFVALPFVVFCVCALS